MHVFAFMRKLDGRKRELRAQGSWPVSEDDEKEHR